MAIWTIPKEYKIDYSPNGDDLDVFSQKVKYCLEEAFVSLKDLHETTETLNSEIKSINSAVNIPFEIEDAQDGQILVYRETTKSFKNEAQSHVGESKSLIFTNGEELLGEYNGTSTLKIDLKDLQTAPDEKDIWHLTRLVENLYLVLDVAELNPDGYDGLSGETFYGTMSDLDTSRSSGTLEDGKFSGEGAILVTNPIFLSGKEIGNAHLVVKHQNVADAEIVAEIAVRPNAIFVEVEVLGIGDGTEQTAELEHTNDLTNYNFGLYFDGVQQKENFSFDTTTGQITFIAPAGAIVTANYFYNWGAENFVAMTKSGTYPDRHNPNRATTQFIYSGDTSGKVATLRITLKRGTGYSQNEIVSTGTGTLRGFKLKHQAISDSFQIVPSTASWSYNAEQNIIFVNAPSGAAMTISYWWKGKSFSVDSFACVFDE